MKGPGSQSTVDSTGTRWCMILWQWPSETSPRLVIRQGWWYSRVGYSRRWTRNFQRRFYFYLCHSTRSVNTRSVNTRSNWIWDSRSANVLVHLLPLLHLHQGFQPYYAR